MYVGFGVVSFTSSVRGEITPTNNVLLDQLHYTDINRFMFVLSLTISWNTPSITTRNGDNVYVNLLPASSNVCRWIVSMFAWIET